MPVRKFRRVEDMPAPWREPGDPALYRAIAAVWELGQRTAAPRFPPGVHKHRSLGDMNRLDEEWAVANFRAFWQRRGGLDSQPS